MVHSEKLVIVSGHFNPLHAGHLDMMEAGARQGELLVVVKNDRQQLEKKGVIIRPEADRLRIVNALSIVSRTLLAVDMDDTVCNTLRDIAGSFPNRNLVFGNGGDTSDMQQIPEAQVCGELGIEMVVGLGGYEKVASSTQINAILGMG